MKDTSKKHKTFLIRTSTYHIGVMPFAMMNSPSTFQGIRHEVSKNKRFVQAFLDNVAVHAEIMNELIMYLQNDFAVISENPLKLKISKLEFSKNKVKHYSHIVSSEDVTFGPRR